MQTTLDEVQKSLEDLRVKELKAVKTSIAVAQEGKTATAQKRDELKNEIEEIRAAVKANLAKLEALQKQKKASDAKATTLERLVAELRASLEEKEATIAALEQKTQELTKTTEELKTTVKEKEEVVKEKEAVIADRETQMSTAYVLIATQKALKKAGLVEKKGSVLGLGGNWQRTGQFDETLFKQIDTRKESEFAIGRRRRQGAGPLGSPEGQLHARGGGSEGEHADRDRRGAVLEGQQVPRRHAARLRTRRLHAFVRRLYPMWSRRSVRPGRPTRHRVAGQRDGRFRAVAPRLNEKR